FPAKAEIELNITNPKTVSTFIGWKQTWRSRPRISVDSGTIAMSVLHLFDVAELAKEAGIAIEDGPGRHGIGGATFLYMLEPAGNRIEVMGDPGYMIFDPAWKT